MKRLRLWSTFSSIPLLLWLTLLPVLSCSRHSSVPRISGEPQEGHGGDILAAQCLQTGYDIHDALLAELQNTSLRNPLLKSSELNRFEALLETLPVYSVEGSTTQAAGWLGTDTRGLSILILNRARLTPLIKPQPIRDSSEKRFSFPREIFHLYLLALGKDDAQGKLSQRLNLVAMDEGPYPVKREDFPARGKRILEHLKHDHRSELAFLDLERLKRIIDETPLSSAAKVIDRNSGLEVDAIADQVKGKWRIFYNPGRLKARQQNERGFTLLVFHEYARILGVEKIDDNYRVSHLLPPIEFWAGDPASLSAEPTDSEDDWLDDDTQNGSSFGSNNTFPLAPNGDPPSGLSNFRLLSPRGKTPLVPGINRLRAWYPQQRFVDGRFSVDGKFLLLMSEPLGERGKPAPNAQTRLQGWDVATGAEVIRVSLNPVWGKVLDFALSEDKAQIAVRFSRDEGKVRLFSTQTAALTHLEILAQHPEIQRWFTLGREAAGYQTEDHSGEGPIAAFTAKNSLIAQVVSGNEWNSAVKFWDPHHPLKVSQLELGGGITSLAFSPDDSKLVAGRFSSAIPELTLWSVPSAKPFKQFSPESTGIQHRLVSFLDPQHLVIFGVSYESSSLNFGHWNLEVWDIQQEKKTAQISYQDKYFSSLDLVAYSPKTATALFFGNRGYYWENNTVMLLSLNPGELSQLKKDYTLPAVVAPTPKINPAISTSHSALILADEKSKEASASLLLFERGVVISPWELHQNPGALKGRDVLYLGTTGLSRPEFYPEIQHAMDLIPNVIFASPLVGRFKGSQAETPRFQTWGGSQRLLEFSSQSHDVTQYGIFPDDYWRGSQKLRLSSGAVTLSGTLTPESKNPFWAEPQEFNVYRDQKFTSAWTDCTRLLTLGGFSGVWRCRRPNGGYVVLSGFEWGDVEAPTSDPTIVRDWLNAMLNQD